MNLITVSACNECNEGRSNLDDKFSLYLSIAVRGQSPEGLALWGERARCLAVNDRFRRELEECSTLDGKMRKFKLDMFQFRKIYDNIFRGLYSKKFNALYPPDRKFKLEYRTFFYAAGWTLADRLFKKEVGKDQFLYGIARCEEDPSVAVGMLIFYKKFAIIGIGGMPESKLRDQDGDSND